MRSLLRKKEPCRAGVHSQSFRRECLFLLASFLILASFECARAEQAYRLIGIVKGKDFSGAVLDDGKSGQTLYRLREELPDGSAISKVLHDSVTIRQSDGASYDLFIVQGARPSSAKAPAPVSRPNTPPVRAYQPPADRAAPAVRSQEPARDEQGSKGRGKRRIPRRQPRPGR